MASAGGNVVFCIAVRATLKTETVVVLLAMAIVILKPALAAATIVFDDVAVLSKFFSEKISKTTARTEYPHRLSVAVRLIEIHLMGEKIVVIASVIEDQAVHFAGCQP